MTGRIFSKIRLFFGAQMIQSQAISRMGTVKLHARRGQAAFERIHRWIHFWIPTASKLQQQPALPALLLEPLNQALIHDPNPFVWRIAGVLSGPTEAAPWVQIIR